MKTSRSLSSLLAVVLLAGFSLSACGGDDKDASSPGTETSASAPASLGGELTEENFFPRLLAAQEKARTSHIEMTIGVGGQSVKASGDVETGESVDDAKMSMTMDMGSAGPGTMKMLLVDKTFYMNLGEMTQNKYATLDLDDKDSPFGQQFGQLMDQADPSKQLEQFEKAVISLEQKGEAQKIDDVEAQRYELVLDTSKIEALSSLPEGSGASVPEQLSYVMYVGPDDLLRRMTFEVAGSKSQMDYSQWGEPVDIKAPSKADISDRDLAELMGGQVQS